jgi:hypothetical protein
MRLFSWLRRNTSRTPRQPFTRRPQLEALEGRLVFSTLHGQEMGVDWHRRPDTVRFFNNAATVTQIVHGSPDGAVVMR